MGCCDRSVTEDKEITGACIECECDINKDGQCIEDVCGYSSLQCEKCGYQPCNQSC